MATAKKQEIGFYAGDIPSNAKIYEISIEQIKVGSKWQTVKVKGSTITKEYYLNTVSNDTLKWFRAIGGTEVRKTNFTPYGVIATQLNSTDPTKTNRHIREYYFKGQEDSYKFYLEKWKSQIKKEKR